MNLRKLLYVQNCILEKKFNGMTFIIRDTQLISLLCVNFAIRNKPLLAPSQIHALYRSTGDIHKNTIHNKILRIRMKIIIKF